MAEPTKLTVVGETSLNGIFDPSLERAPGATEGWLAYSAVFGTLNPYGPHVSGWLAQTTDSGGTFTKHTEVNASDDHGDTWRYVDTVLSSADATALGFLSFDGSAIASQGSRVFLLVTPESPGILHDGTLVIEFADIETGKLVRVGGTPVVTKHLPALSGDPADRRGGQADFHESFVNGIVMPSLQLGSFPEFFHIYETWELLVDPVGVPGVGAQAGFVCVGLLIALGGVVVRSRAKSR